VCSSDLQWCELLTGKTKVNWYDYDADYRPKLPPNKCVLKNDISQDNYRIKDFAGHTYLFLSTVIKPLEVGIVKSQINGYKVITIELTN
jgi:hypothetical protein